MAKSTRTNGRESGTGQDTPLGVCPCPAPLPATPCGTWRDIVPSCPAVPPRLRLKERNLTFGRPSRAPVLLALGSQHRSAMSGRRSRSKGARTERGIVNALKVTALRRCACRFLVRLAVASPATSCCRSWAVICASR